MRSADPEKCEEARVEAASSSLDLSPADASVSASASAVEKEEEPRRRLLLVLMATTIVLVVLTSLLYGINFWVEEARWRKMQPLCSRPGSSAAREDVGLRTAIKGWSGEQSQIVFNGAEESSFKSARSEKRDFFDPASSNDGEDDEDFTTIQYPKYSVSTYPDGEESTFVYTTRPIVNPGGYTIGTITKYVPVPTTTTSSNFDERALEDQEDLHLLHRRGYDFEPPPAQLTLTALPPNPDESLPTAAEYSYSVKKNGETATYVKTTRPIVNPGGYVVGTLDGVFVQVGLPTRAAGVAPGKDKGRHDELRKRTEE